MSSNNAFSFEQTMVMRKAVDIVLAHLDQLASQPRREDVARVVLGLANESDYAYPEELANYAITALTSGSRKSA
jgi:hypothetical protein